MRTAFSEEIYSIMKNSSDTLLLSADIGFKVFDKLRDDFPDRFINMGVAEANMISVASGLAMCGKKPFVYTIIPFLTMRAFEQIRVDVCIQKQPVKIVGVGGGLAYGMLGPTHHAIEDVAILRALPYMTIVVPCDPLESRKATRAVFEYDGPVYVRLGKNGEPQLYNTDYSFKIGKSVILREGADATIISSGPITKVALESAKQLSEQDLEVRVLNMHTIKPIDKEAIINAALKTNAIVSLEEHNIIGGLGSAVAEVLAEENACIPFQRIGINDILCYGAGSQQYHLQKQGLTKDAVSDTIITLLNKK